MAGICGRANRLVEQPRFDCLFLGTALHLPAHGGARKPSVLLGLSAGRPIRAVL